MMGNGDSDSRKGPWLPVVTNHCSSTNLPEVSTSLSNPSLLENVLFSYMKTRNHQIPSDKDQLGLESIKERADDLYSYMTRQIHSIPSEKDQREPFEKLVERVRSYRFIASPMVRTCEMQAHSPTAQSLITLRSLGDQIFSILNTLQMNMEEADSKLRMLVLQYRTVAGQISLKELNQ
jgi:hypothetical protein